MSVPLLVHSSASTAAALRPAPAPLRWWVPALLGVLAVGVYSNSLLNDFAFDDLAIVKNNPHVTSLEWTAIWSDNYWPRTDGIMPDSLYRPLTLWTYLANEALAPGLAWPFHLVNILLHGLVTVLVVLLAWRLVGDRRVAAVAGALFAVHPIHTEAVANTVGRAELLAALWSLLTLLVYLPLRPLVLETAPTRRGWWHGLLVAACFLAAILCKETPATLLLAIPLLDLWRWVRWPVAGRLAWWRWLFGQSLRYYLPLALAFGAYFAMRIPACGLMTRSETIHHIVNPLVAATPAERLVTPFMLLAKYLWITFWPAHLSADYSLPSLLPTANPFYATAFQPPAAAGMLVVALALIVALRNWRKAPQILLLLALFATSYMLVANFLRIGTIFGERLFYWPSVFVLVMVAWAGVAGYQHLTAPHPGRFRIVGAAAAVLVLAASVWVMGRVTWRRNTDWADNVSLAISTARDNPGSGKACSWAGAVLIMSDRPDFVSFGKSLLERSIELTPDYVSARWELAKYYGVRNDLGHSTLCVAEAARLDPGTHITRAAIPALLQDLKKTPPASYMPVIEAYQREHPEDEAAYLAVALAYHAQGRFDEAEANARKAIDLGKHVRPDGFDQFHEAGAELATIWFDRGRVKEAVDKFRIYATYMRNSADAHCTFASMLLALDARQNPEALGEADYNLALVQAIDPTNVRGRELRGQLNRLRKDQSLSLTAAGDAKAASAGGAP